MKPLSQTRQAIVEGFMSEHDYQFVDDNIKWSNDELLEFANDLIQALNDYTESIVRMVDEQIKIWKSMDEDLPVPRLQDQIVEALNDIKEALNDTK